MRIYISIPISGFPIEQQRAKAREIAKKLKALGHEPVNPFDTPEAPQGLSEKEQYAYYMGEDLKRLLMCDAVFFCDGWYQSNGCCLEYHAAEHYDIKTYSHFEDVPNEMKP